MTKKIIAMDFFAYARQHMPPGPVNIGQLEDTWDAFVELNRNVELRDEALNEPPVDFIATGMKQMSSRISAMEEAIKIQNKIIEETKLYYNDSFEKLERQILPAQLSSSPTYTININLPS